jgi:hypothetical protein
MCLAGVTEAERYNDGNVGAASMGENALTMFFPNENAGKFIRFSTYATNRNNRDDFKNMNFPSHNDYDSSWNWVYFGYNTDLQKAYAQVYFSFSEEFSTLTWDQTVHTDTL